MDSYLSHISAALALDVPYLHAALGYSDAAALANAFPVVSRCYLELQLRKQRQDEISRYKVLPLPKGAIISHNGEAVASPELVFLELAKELGFHRSVLLGMQLCAGSPNSNVRPLTSVAKIKRFLEKTAGHHGHVAATGAARYIADNSWSIIESLLFMLLTLPIMYGGFGLKGAVLNHEILLKEKIPGQKTNRVVADLYWDKAKLVVEYDSYQYHDNVQSWMHDAQRATTLEKNGYQTLSINAAQLYREQPFVDCAQLVALRLGKRIQIRTKQFAPAYQALRSLLPGRDTFERLM